MKRIILRGGALLELDQVRHVLAVVKYRTFLEASSFPCAVISTTAQTNASEVLLIMLINSFPSEGIATINASGMMIWI